MNNPGWRRGNGRGSVFTGIIETVGTVRGLVRRPAGARVTIGAPAIAESARLGDSLAAIPPACSARTIIDSVMFAVRAFVGTHPQSDDITLLALRWHGPSGNGPPAAD